MNVPFDFLSNTLTVTDVTRHIRNLLEEDDLLGDVWVTGEVSNYSRPLSGHLYFSIKDENATLRCVMWRSQASSMRVKVADGMSVEAHGKITLYERDGRYQLLVDSLRLAGEGDLYQEFLRLKTRLEAEGLFANERKRRIPDFPCRIGIVTSATGAALQDMLNTLAKRYPLVEVILAPSSVQGDRAPYELVAALGRINRYHPDVILLARGGGSLEDLWAFNDERVVRAIAASPSPVITGIGHETDFTLADFAADVRAPTPTGAAVIATPDSSDLLARIAQLESRLHNRMVSMVRQQSQGLTLKERRLDLSSPQRRIEESRLRIDQLSEHAQRLMFHRLDIERLRVRDQHNHLEAISPQAVLSRGYAILTGTENQILTSIHQVQTDDRIQARLKDGVILTHVIDKEEINLPASLHPG